ncbi:NACHT domain-containing protein [Actinoallomurus sp. CA-150999]|uniref:NACHT N-terminal Helical domain 1-containing protein n=1 Tax=Actinoallomurus sp. CA-150999 TaxID=3239887 RepID=UPI003D94A1A6
MTGLEPAAAAAAKAVAQRAGREWLAARAAKADRDKDLTELIRVSLPDRFVRRKLERQLADIADSVEKRLAALVEQEYGGLGESDRAAVLLDVRAAMERLDLSDDLIFGADADPVKLARRVRGLVPSPAGHHGEAASRLYDVMLDECCDCLVRILLGLPEFTPRALVETLSRTSDLGNQISLVLERLPARTLDAPAGTQNDAEFERRYLEHVARSMDAIELFGLRVDNYRPRATLSVAYISLSATAEDRRREGLEPLKVAALTGDQGREPSTMRAEGMLARSSRTLLRGQAGSGKSTLLGWITVTAARRAFTGDLADWNGRVPFLIKLRSCAESGLPRPEDLVTGPLQGLMPPAWVHRVLGAGRGIILVDGVDEVPQGRRDEVRQWLRKLLDVYPSVRTVVTSRPAAADTRWLSAEGFRPVMLEPMTPDDLRELVRQWHAAVRHAGSLPCAPEELPGYEGTLLARLESGPHLRALATTPLLAAMLCALNLDRVSHLPRDRMGLYRAVLDMLLERRDVERGVRSHPGIELERGQKERLLQELAWRLTILGRAEMSKTTALRRMEARSAAMPRVTASAEELLDYLLHRSGVIREPVPGRIDFVHRTVQEYLAARQAADDADVETLVEKAHLDQWRDTVVMAAGHANAPLRRDLISGLLDRAEAEPKHGHRLRMLVAACLETVPDVPHDSRDRVEKCVSRLIPPKNAADARRLAAAGEEILRRLPESLDGLTEAQAAATVQTVWLINGPEAMRLLAGYAADPRSRVQSELVNGWDYFEPHSYAEQVLAQAPLLNGWLTLDNPALLPAVARLERLERLDVNLPKGYGLENVTGIPALRRICAEGVKPATLSLLVEHASLEEIWLDIEGALGDVSLFEAFPRLDELSLYPDRFVADLGCVARLHALRSFGAGGLGEVSDYSPLADQRGLQQLYLHNCPKFADIEALCSLDDLRTLFLSDAHLPQACCDQLAVACAKLGTLSIYTNQALEDLNAISDLRLGVLQVGGCVRIGDISPLARLTGLTRLDLGGVPFTDLTPVGALRSLGILVLDGCPATVDLGPLGDLPRLRSLFLLDAADGVDLVPLAGLRNLTIHLYEGQRVQGLDRLHRTTRIRWQAREHG